MPSNLRVASEPSSLPSDVPHSECAICGEAISALYPRCSCDKLADKIAQRVIALLGKSAA